MKSSSALFQDRFHSYSKRERCFNLGSAVPFVLTSLFIASIFSFFLLHSPEPLTVTPIRKTSDIVAKSFENQQDQQQPKPSPQMNQQLPQPQTETFPSKPKTEQKINCDLAKGHWVPALREPSYYTNSSCTTIPDSKNCFKHGRMDSDFLNWQWKPDQCELPRFNPMTFLHIVRGKKLAFIGDSVARNHMESLLCLLSQVS